MIRILLLSVVLLSGLDGRLPAQIRLGSVHGSVGFGVRIGAPVIHPSPVRRPVLRPRVVVAPVRAPVRVWVEGYWQTVEEPAVYGYRTDACGRTHRVVIRPACFKRVWHPGYWRTTDRCQ